MDDMPIDAGKERAVGSKIQFKWMGKGVTDTRQVSEESNI
jgi:hypothetical protein